MWSTCLVKYNLFTLYSLNQYVVNTHSLFYCDILKLKILLISSFWKAIISKKIPLVIVVLDTSVWRLSNEF